MIGAARHFLDRINAGVNKTMDLTGMSKWLQRNTASPKIIGAGWSFKDHEMQMAVADDPRHHVVVRKCSQIGLSELSVRICLALLSIYPGSTAIYTLPTAAYARKFTKARIDPVVAASEYLKAQVPSGNDSSELKQIGTSFLYVVGTSGQSSPISIPADILIREEVDFSNQAILTQFYSRLGHARDGGIIRDFSTPTVDGYGISKVFEESSQARYLIECDHCHEKVAPNFLLDVVVPGFDSPLVSLEPADIDNQTYKFHDAWLKCPSCGNPLTYSNLCDPGKREWVDEYQDKVIGGFQIVPFDVPTVNPISKTILALRNYQRRADWVNFELGLPFQDAENSFIESVIKDNTVIDPVMPRVAAAYGCVAGLDIGKISHLTIGRRIGRTIDILWMEQIRQTEGNNLQDTVLERMSQFGVQKLVVDAGPDFTTAMTLIGKSRTNQVFGCYYVRSNRTAFANMDVQEEEQIVNANKVRCFDRAVKETNNGRVRFPKVTDMAVFREHCRSMKRVTSQNKQGDSIAAWVNTSADHYAHSLNYLMIADEMCDYVSKNSVVAVLPHIGRVQFGGAHVPEKVESLLRGRR